MHVENLNDSHGVLDVGNAIGSVAMTQSLYVQLELMLCRYKSAAQDTSLNIV